MSSRGGGGSAWQKVDADFEFQIHLVYAGLSIHGEMRLPLLLAVLPWAEIP